MPSSKFHDAKLPLCFNSTDSVPAQDLVYDRSKKAVMSLISLKKDAFWVLITKKTMYSQTQLDSVLHLPPPLINALLCLHIGPGAALWRHARTNGPPGRFIWIYGAHTPERRKFERVAISAFARRVRSAIFFCFVFGSRKYLLQNDSMWHRKGKLKKRHDIDVTHRRLPPLPMAESAITRLLIAGVWGRICRRTPARPAAPDAARKRYFGRMFMVTWLLWLFSARESIPITKSKT